MDLIDRKDVIDLLQMNREEENKKSLSAECKHKSVIRSKHDAHVAFCDYLIECVKQLPTHKTPSNTLGALDCVERQAAIDVLIERDPNCGIDSAEVIKELPSTEPTLYGYNIKQLDLIARILQKENLPPERVAEALSDMGSIVAMAYDEFTESLRKAVEQCTI